MSKQLVIALAVVVAGGCSKSSSDQPAENTTALELGGRGQAWRGWTIRVPAGRGVKLVDEKGDVGIVAHDFVLVVSVSAKSVDLGAYKVQLIKAAAARRLAITYARDRPDYIEWSTETNGAMQTTFRMVRTVGGKRAACWPKYHQSSAAALAPYRRACRSLGRRAAR